MNIKFILIMLLLLSGVVQADIVDSDEYIIKFGLLKDNVSTFEVVEETLEIPLITIKQDADFKFGYTLERINNTDFLFHHVLHMPRPAEYTSNVAAHIDEQQDTSSVTYEGKTVSAFGGAITRFDEGDRPGKYQMDIYINNQLVKVIEFNVYLEKLD